MAALICCFCRTDKHQLSGLSAQRVMKKDMASNSLGSSTNKPLQDASAANTIPAAVPAAAPGSDTDTLPPGPAPPGATAGEEGAEVPGPAPPGDSAASAANTAGFRGGNHTATPLTENDYLIMSAARAARAVRVCVLIFFFSSSFFSFLFLAILDNVLMCNVFALFCRSVPTPPLSSASWGLPLL